MIIAVERSETAHYFYEKMLATSIRRSTSRFGVDSFVPRSFGHFTYSMVEFIHLFVGEHVFLPNELSAKRLAICISRFNVGYPNFNVQIWSAFSFVRSFRLPLCCPCSLAESTPNNTCVKQYCVSMHEVPTAHRFGDEV